MPGSYSIHIHIQLPLFPCQSAHGRGPLDANRSVRRCSLLCPLEGAPPGLYLVGRGARRPARSRSSRAALPEGSSRPCCAPPGAFPHPPTAAPDSSAHPTPLPVHTRTRTGCLCITHPRINASLRDKAAGLGPGLTVRDAGDGRGKGLFADRPFSEGELVLREPPLLACQGADNRMDALLCGHCMRFVGSVRLQVARRVLGGGGDGDGGMDGACRRCGSLPSCLPALRIRPLVLNALCSDAGPHQA